MDRKKYLELSIRPQTYVHGSSEHTEFRVSAMDVELDNDGKTTIWGSSVGSIETRDTMGRAWVLAKERAERLVDTGMANYALIFVKPQHINEKQILIAMTVPLSWDYKNSAEIWKRHTNKEL